MRIEQAALNWRGAPPKASRADVWTIGLDACPAAKAACFDTLSVEEHERSARFRHILHRQRFRTGRAALRAILSVYTGIAPAEITFAQGPAGKPHLAGGDRHALHFSFSRAEAVALLAIAPRPVGIDVAPIDSRFACAGVASTAFDRSEVQAWSRLPERCRTSGFFKGWTSREAVVKADGTGLGSPYRFSVCVDPELPPRILHGATGWRLHPVPCPQTHAAVICTPPAIETLRMLCWEDWNRTPRREVVET